MMKINKSIILIVVLLLNKNIKSNPIMPIFFNELQVDSIEWVLELYPFGIINLEGWYLTSSTDTAYFKDNIYLPNDFFLIITQDSLLNPLSINSMGDSLFLYDSTGFEMDSLIFGEFPGSMIINPQPFQSLCRYHVEYEFYSEDFYYLDNTPTIGLENDLENAIGNIEGIVTDTSGVPIDSVRVFYDIEIFVGSYIDSVFVFTDEYGYFIFSHLASRKYFQLDKNGYQTQNFIEQIYPDSTISLSIMMEEIVQSIDDHNGVIPTKFELVANYPNPFNSTTSITYQIPINTYVEIVIYNSIGQFVSNLFSGFQSSGMYRTNWNSEYLASGIYIYQLKTPEKVISRKCLLLK